MKLLVVFAAVIAFSLAAPLDSSKDAQILKFQNNNEGLGSYNFAYETSDGVSRQEQAEMKNAGTDQESLVVRGIIKWVGDDGQEYTLNYIADENGFQPEGKHLPKA